MKCHNCQYTFEGKFCNNCGQKYIANQRLKMSEVIVDFFDNTFNLHKGFLYTFWLLLKNPGKVAHSYIGGQRKQYINPTRYLVIALAFQTFIDFWFKTTEIIRNETYFKFSFLSAELNKSMEIWNVKLAIEYILLTNIVQIAIIPAILYFLFKKSNFNYTELLTVNFYFTPTILFITMLVLFITKVIFGIFISKEILIFIFITYLIWSNMDFFKSYKFANRLLRILLFLVIFMLIRIFFLPFFLSLIIPLT